MIQDTSAQDQVRTPKRKTKPMLLAAALLVLGLGLIASLVTMQAESSIASSKIRTAQVIEAQFERVVNATGRVIASNAPSLYSVAAGRVHFLKQPGAAVQVGEIVATLLSPDLLNQHAQQSSALQSAQITLQRQRLDARQQKLALKKSLDLSRVNQMAALRNLKRAKASFAQQVISLFDFEQASDDLLTANLNLENSQLEQIIKSEMIDFELQTIELALSKQQLVAEDYQRKINLLSLRSPVQGIIGNWLQPQDNTVDANTALLTVVDLSAYAAELDIPQSFADELSAGMSVSVRLGAKTLAAKLTSVSPEVQNNNVKARLEFSDARVAGLRQNQNLSASILLESRANILQVERGAFLQAGDFAYVIREGVAYKRPIKIGSRSLNRVEILSGLATGDTIIISSVENFKQLPSIHIIE